MKKRVSQVNKEEKQKREAFWNDIKSVEEKHNRKIDAIAEYTYRGMICVLADREKQQENGNTKTGKTD